MLVAATGWQLLRSDSPRPLYGPLHEKASGEGAVTGSAPAFYPLTFPLTVGPGTISVSIGLSAEFRTKQLPIFIGLIALVVGAAMAAAVIYLSYRFAGALVRTLGEAGTIVFLRLASFILLCIGIQIGWHGISELVQSLHT